MIEPHIIDDLKRREEAKRRSQSERPALQLPLSPERSSPESAEPNKDREESGAGDSSSILLAHCRPS